MDDGEEEEAEDLEVRSQQSRPPGDGRLVEQIVGEPHQGDGGETQGDDGAGPDSQQDEEETQQEAETEEEEELSEQQHQNQQPVGHNQGNQHQAETTEEKFGVRNITQRLPYSIENVPEKLD